MSTDEMAQDEGNDAEANRVGMVVSGKYRLTEVLGEGGMGVVYGAFHVDLRSVHAVKFLQSELAGNRKTRKRFLQEAQLAATFKSENLVRVTDFGTADDDVPYFVMDRLHGETLAKVIKGSPGGVIPDRAVRIVIQACKGLAEPHALDIVHRDLKPENLFICKDADGADLVKVVDFGIAKAEAAAGQEHSALTRPGALMGTSFYMSPEQARSEDADRRSDVYALGVILYELLSGRKPYDAEKYHEIINQILAGKPVPLGDLCPNLSSGLVKVVERAMALERDHRFASTAELVDALTPFKSHVSRPASTRAAADGRLQRTEPALTPIAHAVPVDGVPRPSRPFQQPSEPPVAAGSAGGPRSRKLVVAGAVGLAGLGAALLAFLPVLTSRSSLPVVPSISAASDVVSVPPSPPVVVDPARLPVQEATPVGGPAPSIGQGIDAPVVPRGDAIPLQRTNGRPHGHPPRPADTTTSPGLQSDTKPSSSAGDRPANPPPPRFSAENPYQ